MAKRREVVPNFLSQLCHGNYFQSVASSKSEKKKKLDQGDMSEPPMYVFDMVDLPIFAPTA